MTRSFPDGFELRQFLRSRQRGVGFYFYDFILTLMPDSTGVAQNNATEA